MGAPAPQSVVDQVRTVDWAVEAFRAAGLDVHTEPYTSASNPATAVVGQQYVGPENVVAEIRGREKPDEIVVLIGVINPFQLRDHPEMAADAAVLVEAARDIKVTGLVPRRTLRFVLLLSGGTDACSASDYTNSQDSEMVGTIAVIFVSQGAGHGTRFLLNGRHDIEPQVAEALKPLQSLALAPVSYDQVLSNCTEPFLLQGVPTLVANPEQWASRSSPIALDQTDIQELERHAAIGGVTAFDVAEDVAPLGPRLAPAEAETLMKKTPQQ